MGTVAKRASVHGRVQGVGFRFHTQAKANQLGVTGWVRNEYDGTVSVHAEGDAAAVDTLIAWLHGGPSYASVTHVDSFDTTPEGRRGFNVR